MQAVVSVGNVSCMQLVDIKKLFILGDTIPIMEKKITVLVSYFYVADQFCLHSKNMVWFQIYYRFWSVSSRPRGKVL